MRKNCVTNLGWTTLAQVRLVEDNFHRFPSQYPASPALTIGDPRNKTTLTFGIQIFQSLSYQ